MMKRTLAICAAMLMACSSVVQADDKEKTTEQNQQVGIQIRTTQTDGSGKVKVEVEETVNGKTKKYQKEIPVGENNAKVQFQVFTNGEDLPKHVREMIKKLEAQAAKNGGEAEVSTFGSITVVGPDGKTTTKSFGGKNADDKQIQKELKDALEKHLKALPSGGIQIEDIVLPQFQLKTIKPNLKKANAGDDVLMKKLDLVLKRLDKIEKELSELKEKE